MGTARTRHWAFNIALGILIELLLVATHDSGVVTAARNWALDLTMRGHAAVQKTRSGDAIPLAIIDVDEETWRNAAWGGGEPYYAPRRELLGLIDRALARQAAIVVVDIVVETPETPGDREFAAAIAALVPRLRAAHQQLIFARTISEPVYAKNALAPAVHASPLDTLIREFPGQLKVAAPYFRPSRDGITREWELWRVACRVQGPAGAGRWSVLPSVQLLIASALKDPSAATPWDNAAARAACNPMQAQDVAEQERRVNDSTWQWLRSHPSIVGHSQIREARFEDADLANEIFFRYPNSSSGPRRISALKILDGDSRFASKTFDHGVVIIGQSFRSAADEHATPLGAMSGPLLIANSLDSLLEPGLLQPPPPLARWMLVLISIVFVGWVFARFDSVVGTLVILVTFLPLLLAINYIFLQYGLWLDFAVPLLGLFVHRVVKGAEQYLELLTFKRGEAAGSGTEGDQA